MNKLKSFFNEASFLKATMDMQFSAKEKAGCPKVARDLNFPPRKDGILHPPSGCPGTPHPLPQSLYGQVGVR